MRGGKSIELSIKDCERLQTISKSRQKRERTKMRATILLFSNKSMSSKKIGSALGIAERTVRNTRYRWKQFGYEGLEDRKRRGRPPVADQKYLRFLAATVEKDPKKCGYAFRRWTVPRLAEYLKQKTGIEVTTRWITVLLHKQGFVWRRTKQTTQNLQNKSEVIIAKKRLERSKKGLCKGTQTMSFGTLMA